MQIVYVDNNATTQIAPEVYEAMVPFLTDSYFNPSSMYEAARGAANAIAVARKGIAQHLGRRGCQTDPIHFLRYREQQHGHSGHGQRESEPAPHHHDDGRASGGVGSL